MRTKYQLIIAVVVVVLIALSTTGGTTGQEKAKEQDQQRNITTLELAISPDGRSIVDQNGKIVAQFVDDMRVQMPKVDAKADGQVVSQNESLKTPSAKSQKLKGCLRCVPACLIYDKDGKCVKEYQSCTWDFDC